MIRYLLRPPVANERLRLLPDGRVACALKKRWRDGTSAVVLDPLTFLERLAALVPRPRKKLINYYGMFASAASYRHRVVPERATKDESCAHGAAAREHRHDLLARVRQTGRPPSTSERSQAPVAQRCSYRCVRSAGFRENPLGSRPVEAAGRQPPGLPYAVRSVRGGVRGAETPLAPPMSTC
jgi:hypothetical protein